MTEHKIGGRAQGKTLELLKVTQERAVELDKMLKKEQERAERYSAYAESVSAREETLEILLFEFVLGRIARPAGRYLSKSDDEILLKTLEIINAGMKMVDFEKARERLLRAQALMQERSEDGGDEEI